MSLLRSSALLCSLLILGGCGAKEAQSQLSPQPPIWVVSDADSEVTLYPTLHILPPDIKWKSDELAKRLASAEEIWFEILPGSENDSDLEAVMAELAFNPNGSLTSQLNAQELEALKTAITPLNMSLSAANEMQPWFLTNLVAIGALIEKGFAPNAGVEKQLYPLVAGKKIRALETAESQMRMLASLPEETQMEMLRQTLLDMNEGIDELKGLAADWAIGDVEDLEENLLDEMKRETPVAYDAVFTARNKNWADQIEREMQGSGTDFIAVGAGHLVGRDGVPALLRARGYSVNRL